MKISEVTKNMVLSAIFFTGCGSQEPKPVRRVPISNSEARTGDSSMVKEQEHLASIQKKQKVLNKIALAEQELKTTEQRLLQAEEAISEFSSQSKKL